MKIMRTIGLATAALAVAGFAGAASAADMDKGSYGGSKGGRNGSAAAAPAAHADGYQWGHHAARSPAGPCYFRADLGYSVAKDPTVKWPVSTVDLNFGGAPIYTYLGEDVSNVTMDNTWFGGLGAGCGTGSWGIRGELMLDFRGNRKIDGEPYNFTVINPPPAVPPALPPYSGNVDDPLHTSVKSTTLMANVYKDFGNFGGFMPYVGFGVGVAHNKLSETYFTQNVYLVNRIEGASKVSFAWSLMAGIGWQVSDRAILDFGYRYIDMGSVRSGRVDSAGFVNPAVRVEDIAAHEFKIGLRYHFGESCCQAASYAPMK
jgi:opacity protein-like surface antigen